MRVMVCDYDTGGLVYINAGMYRHFQSGPGPRSPRRFNMGSPQFGIVPGFGFRFRVAARPWPVTGPGLGGSHVAVTCFCSPPLPSSLCRLLLSCPSLPSPCSSPPVPSLLLLLLLLLLISRKQLHPRTHRTPRSTMSGTVSFPTASRVRLTPSSICPPFPNHQATHPQQYFRPRQAHREAPGRRGNNLRSPHCAHQGRPRRLQGHASAGPPRGCPPWADRALRHQPQRRRGHSRWNRPCARWWRDRVPCCQLGRWVPGRDGCLLVEPSVLEWTAGVYKCCERYQGWHDRCWRRRRRRVYEHAVWVRIRPPSVPIGGTDTT